MREYREMKIGTKSLLFGVHQFLIHPLFVLWGWVKLYGWPNWKELICIIIHDWGYWGCADMDGEEGENHTKWAANTALKFLDTSDDICSYWFWYRDLCLFHSRFFAQKTKNKPSRLCWADKLGSALYPAWLWVFLGTMTGEIKEYMESMKHKERITETNPFRYFKVYRDEVVPDLLKEHGILPEKNNV
jgi:hypothetical protein